MTNTSRFLFPLTQQRWFVVHTCGFQNPLRTNAPRCLQSFTGLLLSVERRS